MAAVLGDHSSTIAFSQLLSAAEAASVDHSRSATTPTTTATAGADYHFNSNGRRDSSAVESYAVGEVRDGHVNGSSISVANGAVDERPQKRRKVALACDGCRERKTRCDGERPVCGSCKRRSRVPGQCVYKSESVRTSVADGSIEALHNRIRELESRYRRDSALSSSGSPTSAGQQSHAGVANHGYEAEEPQSLPPPGQDHVHSHSIRKLSVDQVLSSPWQPVQNGSGEYRQSHPGGIPNGDGHARTTSLASQSALSSTPQYGAHVAVSSDGDNVQPASRPTSEGQDTRDHPSPIDAMGATSTANESAAVARNNYWGGASVSTFAQHFYDPNLFKTGSPDDKTSLQALHTSKTIPHNLSNKSRRKSPLTLLCEERPRLQLEDFALPPRHLADHLINRYWLKVSSLYPFLHKPTFVKAYERLWSTEPESISLVPSSGAGLGNAIDGSPDTPLFYCALNALFAIGCLFSDIPLEQRQSVSNIFFQRSKQLLRLDVLDNGSISLVQTLLLVAQYLRSTSYPTRCWNSIGIACRVAQGLGLHLENNKTQDLPSLELEIRRRTWYGCVTLDMVVSMTLGRPTMTLHSSAVPLPTAIDDEYLLPNVHSCTQPPTSFSRTAFFVQTIKLYKILGTILSSVYEPWTGGNGNDARNGSPSTSGNNESARFEHLQSGRGFDTIISLDSALGRFHAEVPELLRWPPRRPSPDGVVHSASGALKYYDPDPDGLPRQANVLHARYLHLRILLYRPIFTQLCRTPPTTSSSAAAPAAPALPTTSAAPTGETMTSYFATRCAISCVSAACDILSLIHSNLHTDATGAWWYNVFYTHTAGMVLIMAGLCGPIQGYLDSAQVERAWGWLNEILGDEGLGWSGTARRSREVLERLRARVGESASGLVGGKVEQPVAQVFTSGGLAELLQPPAERSPSRVGGYPDRPTQGSGEDNTANKSQQLWEIVDEAWWNGPTFDLFLEGSPNELDPGL